jgi:tetratricopeptide (TPR) repeat protein
MAKEWACACGQVNGPSDPNFSSHKCSACGRDKWVPFYAGGAGLIALALLIALVMFMLGRPAGAYKDVYKRYYKADQIASEREQAELEKMAKRYRFSPDRVQVLQEEARKELGIIAQVPPSPPPFPCSLQPARVSDVAKLLQYLKQGMNYGSQRQYEEALAEFQQVLNIDPNFLGVHQNIGAAYTGLKRYDAAEKELKAEMKLLSCLDSMNDEQLTAFSYMIETPVSDPLARKTSQVQMYRTRLTSAEAASHYNLACVYSLQNQKDAAIGELQSAVKAGFSDAKALRTDPELANVRKAAAFRELLASISQHSM